MDAQIFRVTDKIYYPGQMLTRALPSGCEAKETTKMRTACTYLLPLRRTTFRADESAELRRYFLFLQSMNCEVLVIDGSPESIFDRHDAVWSCVCRHERVDRRFGYRNDKVNGVHTGVECASNDHIILADDDIRYTTESLEAVRHALDEFEVVRPQNFLHPLPWWAKLEAARMLINRATLRTADYPGTCAFRRLTMRSAGHYDGDVLFDNEEIIRHFARQGTHICYATDLFVQKRPPSFQKWLEQRPRQAYEDFALRAKTALFSAILPLIFLAAILRGIIGALLILVVMAGISILLAAAGRSRGVARQFFPRSICFHAPLWILERACSTYWAFFWWLRRGGYPFGDQLLSRGVGRDWSIGGRIASRKVREGL
jgi:hypothetical protein